MANRDHQLIPTRWFKQSWTRVVGSWRSWRMQWDYPFYCLKVPWILHEKRRYSFRSCETLEKKHAKKWRFVKFCRKKCRISNSSIFPGIQFMPNRCHFGKFEQWNTVDLVSKTCTVGRWRRPRRWDFGDYGCRRSVLGPGAFGANFGHPLAGGGPWWVWDAGFFFFFSERILLASLKGSLLRVLRNFPLCGGWLVLHCGWPSSSLWVCKHLAETCHSIPWSQVMCWISMTELIDSCRDCQKSSREKFYILITF